jgi:peptidoglycan/LPS O-acetylase OafA/YrhL
MQWSLMGFIRTCSRWRFDPPSKISTFGLILDKNRGLGPGFHTVRWLLALVVIAFHSTLIVPGDAFIVVKSFWLRPLTFTVPAFFTIGGFLVTGSAYRAPTLKAFFTLRFLRLFPALLVETVISAVLLGLLATNLPLGEYFSSSGFFLYFGSLFGRIQTTLPGVFDSNVLPVVNISLWTIPGELLVYVIVAYSVYARFPKGKHVALYSGIAYFVFNLISDIALHRRPTDSFPVRTMILAAVAGGLMFVWQRHVPHRRSLFFAALALCFFTLSVPELDALSAILISYLVMYVGLIEFGTNIPIVSSRDLSYGIYVYGFPVQQLVQDKLPGITVWYENIFVALPIIFCVALFSWHCVEVPSLKIGRAMKGRSDRALAQQSAVTLFFAFIVMLTYGLYVASTSHTMQQSVADLAHDPVKAAPYLGAIVVLAALGMLNHLSLLRLAQVFQVKPKALVLDDRHNAWHRKAVE